MLWPQGMFSAYNNLPAGSCWCNTHKHPLIQYVLLMLKWQTKKEFLLGKLMNLLDTICGGYRASVFRRLHKVC